MKTLKLTILMVMFLLIASSCRQDDDMPTPTGPELIYPETTLYATFGTKGYSELPQINWNGEVGEISISAFSDLIGVDKVNGQIYWQHYVSLGMQEFTVIATNSYGQAAVELKLINEFSGHFEGLYNHDPKSIEITDKFTLVFETDGSLTVENDGVSGSGTWTREEDELTAIYQYDGLPSNFTIQGKIANNPGSLKRVFGKWYNGKKPDEDKVQGYMELVLQ